MIAVNVIVGGLALLVISAVVTAVLCLSYEDRTA